MHKKFYLCVVILCTHFFLPAQDFHPVKWNTSVEQVGDLEYCLIAEAIISEGWNLYAQNIPENGPIPTTFKFEKNNDLFKLKGSVEEERGYEKFDEIFEMNVKYFKSKARFVQTIIVSKNQKTNIRARVQFMVCNENTCLPPKEELLVFRLN